jgi:hypothetical protein
MSQLETKSDRKLFGMSVKDKCTEKYFNPADLDSTVVKPEQI